MEAEEWSGAGGCYPMLYQSEAGMTAESFDEWWEAEPPENLAQEWVVRLYHPNTSEIASESVYSDYYEALNAGESQMPFWDVDILPVREPE